MIRVVLWGVIAMAITAGVGWLFGVAAAPTTLWPVVGPLSITALFVFISVPMTDKKTLRSRPHYAEHMKKTIY